MANTPIGIPSNWEEAKAALEQAVDPLPVSVPGVAKRREYVPYLKMNYPLMPPSSNHIYMPIGGHGRMALTKEARAYAEQFSEYIHRNYGHLINRLNPEGVFAVHIYFFFPTLLNKGWDTKVKSRRPLSRYKRLDLENRRKLLDDCIRDAIGIDDSLFLATSAEKHHDPVNPHLEIILQEVDPSLFGM